MYYFTESYFNSFLFSSSCESYFKKVFFYIEETAKNIIVINNNFSQNLVDRLLATKFIRLNNALSKENKKNNSILEKQYVNNIRLSKIQVLSDTAIEPILFISIIPIIIISLKIGFFIKLGVFILLARFIPLFKRVIITLEQFTVSLASVKNMINLIKNIDKQKEVRTEV